MIERMLKMTERPLSDQYRRVVVYCPGCQGQYWRDVPVEYDTESEAWRVHGLLAITCPTCSAGHQFIA